MSGLVPHSELTKKAIAWICEQQELGRKLPALIAEAGVRFNLGPLDEEFLTRFFAEKNQQDSSC